jgi:hypothetical protein
MTVNAVVVGVVCVVMTTMNDTKDVIGFMVKVRFFVCLSVSWFVVVVVVLVMVDDDIETAIWDVVDRSRW